MEQPRWRRLDSATPGEAAPPTPSEVHAPNRTDTGADGDAPPPVSALSTDRGSVSSVTTHGSQEVPSAMDTTPSSSSAAPTPADPNLSVSPDAGPPLSATVVARDEPPHGDASSSDPEAPHSPADEVKSDADPPAAPQLSVDKPVEGATTPETTPTTTAEPTSPEPAPSHDDTVTDAEAEAAVVPVVPTVPFSTKVRTYFGHAYTHDGTATAATHAFVISWLVVFSLLVLVLEGAPEFKKYDDGMAVAATETVEPTATPELLVQVRQVVQEEISRSRSLPGAVAELPTVTPQPTPQPTPTMTDAETAAATVVERTPWFALSIDFESPVHLAFVVTEGLVALLFSIDYILNIAYAKRWQSYALGLWGIIDIVAILPFFVVLGHYLGLMGDGALPPWVVFVQGLRILRAIKLFRVVSETKTENSLGEIIEGSTVHRDLLFGSLFVFGSVAILEIVGWTADRHLFWLSLGLFGALNVSLRRWCMHAERSGLSALLVFATLIVGTVIAISLDRTKDPLIADWTAALIVFFIFGSWLQIESKEGAL